MKPDVRTRIALPNGNVVTLYDGVAAEFREGRELTRNLICTTPDGEEVWRAKPPGDPDSCVGVSWDGVRLTANTWSGYQVSVDQKGGAVTVLAFTK